VEALIKKPYTEGGPNAAATPTTSADSNSNKGQSNDLPPPSTGEKPTLKKPNP
jgi:hypothetical protein